MWRSHRGHETIRALAPPVGAGGFAHKLETTSGSLVKCRFQVLSGASLEGSPREIVWWFCCQPTLCSLGKRRFFCPLRVWVFRRCRIACVMWRQSALRARPSMSATLPKTAVLSPIPPRHVPPCPTLSRRSFRRPSGSGVRMLGFAFTRQSGQYSVCGAGMHLACRTLFERRPCALLVRLPQAAFCAASPCRLGAASCVGPAGTCANFTYRGGRQCQRVCMQRKHETLIARSCAYVSCCSVCLRLSGCM